MPAAKKTTAKKTTAKSATGSTSLQNKVNSLEEQVGNLQRNLATLTTILEEEFRTHMLQGPKQVAAKIKSAGLLEND